MTRDELTAALIEALAEATPPNVGESRTRRMVGAVLDVVDDLIWSKTGTYTPDPDGELGEFVPNTWRKQADNLQVRLDRSQAFAGILHDLDRCEHGRHERDSCISCGGQSKGNPVVAVADGSAEGWDGCMEAPPRTIGFDLSGNPIVVPEAHPDTDPDAWRTR